MHNTTDVKQIVSKCNHS